MIKSMTGFGRAKELIDGLDITVEIKAVNHRYFEFGCRMPRAFQFMEEQLKSLCHSSIARGKVELSVFIDNTNSNDTVVEINDDYASAYISALRELSKRYRIKNDIKASAFAGNGDIFKVKRRELDEENASKAVISVVQKAIAGFIEMRETEGKKLAEDIVSKSDYILNRVAEIEARSPETVKAYRERLEARIRELLGDAKVDEQRLLTETAVFADKVAVDEETVRLKSHISQLKTMLETGDNIGKNLDFIIQEMNRETNTIGSKAQDVEIAHIVVDIKSQIEKIREQVQNIE